MYLCHLVDVANIDIAPAIFVGCLVNISKSTIHVWVPIILGVLEECHGLAKCFGFRKYKGV
jgi:hypothetical protein